MKKLIYLLLSVGILIYLTSCQGFQDYFKSQFPELDTPMYVNTEGTLIVPLATADITLQDLIPNPEDSTKFWIEVGEDTLLHLKSYKKHIVYVQAGANLGFNQTINAGSPVPSAVIPNLRSALFSIPTTQDVRGDFYAADPRLVAYIHSELALDYTVHITQLHFRNSNTDEERTYSVDINIPIEGAEPDSPYYTEAVIDTNNFPEFPDALFFKPDKMSFDFEVQIPNQTLEYDLTPEQVARANVLIDIPFVFFARDVILADTTEPFELDLTEFEQIEYINIDLKLIVDNELPLEGKIYLILTDTLGRDTIGVIPPGSPELADDTIHVVIGGKNVVASAAFNFLPGETDSLGNPNRMVQTITHIKLPNYIVRNIRNSNYTKFSFFYVVKLNTYNSDRGQIVRIYGYNKLKLRIGAKIDYSAIMRVETQDDNNNEQ